MVLFGGAAYDLTTTRIAITKYHLHEIGVTGDSAKPQILAIAFHIATVESLSYAAKRAGHPTMARNNNLIHGFFHIGLGTWNARQIYLRSQKRKGLGL